MLQKTLGLLLKQSTNQHYQLSLKSEIVNIGTGQDVTIAELAVGIKNIVGFEGDIYFNTEMPDGTPRKLLDVSKLKELGWTYKTSLIDGIKKTYRDYVK